MSEESKEIVTKETCKQSLLEAIQKATKEGKAEDAKFLMEAYAANETVEQKAEKDAADYDAQQNLIEANKEASKRDATAKIVSGIFTGICTAAGAVLAALVTGKLTKTAQLAVEEKKAEYGLRFQQEHFKAVKEDDLVTRYGDENFKPR